MKFKVFLISTFLLGLIVAMSYIGSGSDADYSALLSQISPAIVAVHALVDPEQGVWVDASGFIIETSGKVITACHAVFGAAKVIVQLQSGQSYNATIERCSDQDVEAKLYDVAVLQLEQGAGPLSQDWLGDSSKVHPGEDVLVLSHPGPYGEFTVVTGEISSRLFRQYLTAGSKVYRAALLAHATIRWQNDRPDQGYLRDIGEVLALDYSHPRLADLVQFSQPDTIVIAIEEPGNDRLFCGVTTAPSGQELQVNEIDCDALFDGDFVQKVGRSATLDREVEFLKTSAPVNAGSSGGPVFNLSGQVIGIVSWGRSIEITEDWMGYIEDVQLWTGTHFLVPSQAIKSMLEGR